MSTNLLKKHPIVSVIGDSKEPWEHLTEPLGQLIARRGYHLITGAGGGVMTSVAKAFTSVENRKGLCIGIAPIEDHHQEDIPSLKNPYIELPIIMAMNPKATALKQPYSYNRINILTSHAVIALPGGPGTRREVSSAVIRHKPTILFGLRDDFKEFPETPYIASKIEEIETFLQRHLRLSV